MNRRCDLEPHTPMPNRSSLLTPPMLRGPMFGIGRNGNPEPMSATDKIKNAIDDVAGKAKEAWGEATDDDSTKNEGKVDQAKADLKDAGEKVKDAFKH